ncbi:MAG: amidohydrolase [candidate division NC10 bacterium]|nr:amidohydrolase [candidate division NC10 bacterium]
MNSDSVYSSLREEIRDIRLVDAHNHLPTEAEWLEQPETFGYARDFTAFLGYARGDLSKAGMPLDALAGPLTAAEKWARIRPYWPYIRYTGPGAVCRRALSMFCGVDDLTDETIPIIGECVQRLWQPGAYRRLFTEQHRIEVIVNTRNVEPVTETYADPFMAPLLYTDFFALTQSRRDIDRLEAASGQAVYSLQTFLRALDTVIEQGITQRGWVGIKWHKIPYLRPADYGAQDARAAEERLVRILRMPARGGHGWDTPAGVDEMRPFQDYIQHHLVQQAIESHLVDLFLQYPRARFDLLHGSFPYSGELGALTQLFANVYINMSWMEVVSPEAAKRYLSEWLTSIPSNKVFAFGGDQKSPFLVCASAEIVRDNLAEALAAKVVRGEISREHALDLARWYLHDNAWNHFQLGKRWANKRQGIER